jgi:hypothetical protein
VWRVWWEGKLGSLRPGGSSSWSWSWSRVVLKWPLTGFMCGGRDVGVVMASGAASTRIAVEKARQSVARRNIVENSYVSPDHISDGCLLMSRSTCVCRLYSQLHSRTHSALCSDRSVGRRESCAPATVCHPPSPILGEAGHVVRCKLRGLHRTAAPQRGVIGW